MSANKLTKKQEKFPQEYLKDFDLKQAAIRAGYHESRAETTAVNLLKHPLITRQLTHIFQNVMNQKEKLEKEITTYLADVMRACDGAGGESVSTRERLKAAELLGKNLGLFKEDKKRDQTKTVTIIDDIR